LWQRGRARSTPGHTTARKAPNPQAWRLRGRYEPIARSANFQWFLLKIAAHSRTAIKPPVTRVGSNCRTLSALEAALPRERRKNFRVEWNSTATLYDCNGRRARPCIVGNFSNGGAKISGIRPETIPDEFLLRLSPHSPTRKCRVVWRTEDALGAEFADRNAGNEPALKRRDKSRPLESVQG
jgi:hypothetical protein